jgi:hypothetical protein
MLARNGPADLLHQGSAGLFVCARWVTIFPPRVVTPCARVCAEVPRLAHICVRTRSAHYARARSTIARACMRVCAHAHVCACAHVRVRVCASAGARNNGYPRTDIFRAPGVTLTDTLLPPPPPPPYNPSPSPSPLSCARSSPGNELVPARECSYHPFGGYRASSRWGRVCLVGPDGGTREGPPRSPKREGVRRACQGICPARLFRPGGVHWVPARGTGPKAGQRPHAMTWTHP